MRGGASGGAVDPDGAETLAAGLARRRGVVRAAASGYAAQGLAVVTAFLLTPIVLHHVGRTHFGLWILVSAVVSYGSLLDLGISSAVVKYVAEYRALGRSDDARALVTTALWVYGALGAVVIALAAALAPFVPDLFGVPEQDRQLATWLTVLAGVGVGIGIPFSTPRAVLRGLQRFDLANAAAIAGTVLTAAGTLTVIALGRGILAIVAVSVAVTIVLQPVSVWLVRRAAPDVGYSWRGGRRDALREFLGFSSSVWIMQVAGQLLGRSAPVIIGISLPVASVTPYALAQRLSQLAYMSISDLPKLLMPLASEANASRDRDALRSVLVASTRVTLAVGAAFSTLVAILGPELLAVWVGDEYRRYGTLVALLAIAVIADAVSLPATNILLGMGRHRPLAAIAIGAGVANVVLAIALVQRFELVGVAAATLAAKAAGSVLVQLPYAVRAVGMSIVSVGRAAVVPVVAPTAVLALVLELATRGVRIDSLGELAAAAIGGIAIFFGTYLVVGASTGERNFYRSSVSRLLRRSRAPARGEV